MTAPRPSPPTWRWSPSRWPPTTARPSCGCAPAGLQQAVEVFGFHLATVDLRQSSDVHERALAELFTRAGTQYQGQPLDYLALDEDARVALLRAELAQARPLASPWIAYSEDTTRELAVLRAAAAGRARYGKQAVRQTIVSHTETLSDLLEVMVLQKEAGLIAPAGAPIQDDDGLMVVPLFETIPDLQRGAAIMAAWLDLPEIRERVKRAARRAGSHAGLFRQQQGRRLPDLELVAVPGRTRAGGRTPRATCACACSTAAAARWDAAAAPASTPSWRNRRARWPASCA